MKTGFRDSDIATLKTKVNFWVSNVHKNAQKAVEDTTLAVHTHAVQNVAVDKGNLKRDIRFKLGTLAGLVIAGSEDVTYAAHVEFGTSPHGGHPGTREQPFMSPAAEANRRKHSQKMKTAVKKSKTGGTKATAPKAPRSPEVK